ncbi:hypothetical protein Landi51_07142 [Colletotrichum acutatum]
MDGSNISSQVKVSLVDKPWFGFDLDDTLHEFRRASSAATTKTLEAISAKHGTPVDELKEAYGHVLRAKTAGAFSDGKTSYEYRRERFSSVLDRFGLPSDDTVFLEGLLDVYERTLNESLQLKDGAEALLQKLKSAGKKVVVITEGPQDAQERTIDQGNIELVSSTAQHARVEGWLRQASRPMLGHRRHCLKPRNLPKILRPYLWSRWLVETG